MVFLVEAADDICYAIIDLEDAFEVGILPFHEVTNILIEGLTSDETIEYATIPDDDHFRKLQYLRGKVVDFLIRQVIEAFARQEESMLANECNDDLISHCNESAQNIVRSAKRLAFEKVFVNTRKLEIEIGAYSIIDVLLGDIVVDKPQYQIMIAVSEGCGHAKRTFRAIFHR